MFLVQDENMRLCLYMVVKKMSSLGGPALQKKVTLAMKPWVFLKEILVGMVHNIQFSMSGFNLWRRAHFV